MNPDWPIENLGRVLREETRREAKMSVVVRIDDRVTADVDVMVVEMAGEVEEVEEED